MIDSPGACAQVSKFLSDRNIDILNSVSLSIISNVCMVWKMLADLSYYGEPAELLTDFEALKKSNLGSSIRSMRWRSPLDHLRPLYERRGGGQRYRPDEGRKEEAEGCKHHQREHVRCPAGIS